MPVKCKDIVDRLNKLAPPGLAENWDNVGLLIGDKHAEIGKLLIALDATDKVVEEAINEKVDMIVTHHPIIFKGVKKISTSSVIGRKIIGLIKNDISLYSAHTNLDAASEGLSTLLANKLELQKCEVLEPISSEGDTGLCGVGRIANISEMTLEELCDHVKDKLELDHIRVIGELGKKIKKVAVSPGSSMEFSEAAYRAGADVFITGDIKYHDAQEFKERSMALIDAGHYGTESIVVELIMDYLTECFGEEIDIITAASETDPFHIR